MIKIGVSACLLGQNVRYDGGNKYTNLNHYFNKNTYQLIGLCPEVAIGMGTPRKPVHIINDKKRMRMVQLNKPQLDFTEKMELWYAKHQTLFLQYSGFILKSKSPSCGHKTTLHYQTNSAPFLSDGLFTALLKKNNPEIAIINEYEIKDQEKRNQFFIQATHNHIKYK